MNCLFKLLFFASNILVCSFVDGCQTLNITCEGDKTQVYSELYDCVMTKKIWYNNFTAARKNIFVLNIKYMKIKRNITTKLQLKWKKKWTSKTFYNQPWSSFFFKANHSTVLIRMSITVLTPLYCDYSLSSLPEYDSQGGKTYVCVPELLAPCSLRSRRNIKQMFPQLNSTVKLYPSFSQLFTFMWSMAKAQGQPADIFF